MENQLLNDILKEVREKGDYYIPLASLRPALGCDGKSSRYVKEQLLLWAVENRIIYVYREVGQETVIRFFVRTH